MQKGMFQRKYNDNNVKIKMFPKKEQMFPKMFLLMEH